MIANIVGGLAAEVIGIFGQRGKEKREEIKTRIENMQRSWTDEILVVYWFAPSVLAWFNPEHAAKMISSMTADEQFFGIQVAITVAVFGLGKLNGRKAK